MYKRSIIVFSLFHFFFISCSQKSVEEKLDFDEIISLKNGKRLSISDEINRSSDIILIKEKLVIGDKNDDYYFKVFDMNNTEFVGDLGKIGEGPCEIGFPTFIQAIPSNDDDIGLILKSNFGYQEM